MTVFDHIVRDTHHGLRLLRRSPVFTVVAILTLALGIGANAAIFHLIDTIRLRSLAIANPGELAEVSPDGPSLASRPSVAACFSPMTIVEAAAPDPQSSVMGSGRPTWVVANRPSARPSRFWGSRSLSLA
jgi:hypothetical protein